MWYIFFIKKNNNFIFLWFGFFGHHYLILTKKKLLKIWQNCMKQLWYYGDVAKALRKKTLGTINMTNINYIICNINFGIFKYAKFD